MFISSHVLGVFEVGLSNTSQQVSLCQSYASLYQHNHLFQSGVNVELVFQKNPYFVLNFALDQAINHSIMSTAVIGKVIIVCTECELRWNALQLWFQHSNFFPCRVYHQFLLWGNWKLDFNSWMSFKMPSILAVVVFMTSFANSCLFSISIHVHGNRIIISSRFLFVSALRLRFIQLQVTDERRNSFP